MASSTPRFARRCPAIWSTTRLSRRRTGAEGPSALRDRPAAVRGGRSRRPQAQLAQAQAQLGRTERDVHATRRSRKSARSRRVSWTTTSRRTSPRRPGEVRRGDGRHRALNLGSPRSLADRRRRRDRHGADRRSRRTGDPADDGLAVDPIRAYFSLSEQEYLQSPTRSISRRRARRCGRPARA